jgi:DnaJ-class molecular chaperone
LSFRAFSSQIDFNADYYKTLGVGEKQRLVEIKKAYYALAKKYHPDSVDDDTKPETAKLKFAEVSAAYDVLSDTTRRREYDMGRINRMHAAAGSSRTGMCTRIHTHTHTHTHARTHVNTR